MSAQESPLPASLALSPHTAAVDAHTGETVPVNPSAVPVQVALCRAALDAGAIPKDDINPQQGFKFRGMEKILAALGPAMSKHGVVPMPKVVAVEREQMERGGKGAVWRLVTLTVEYRFVGPAGDCLTATVLGEGLDNADKALPKAMTMAYKAALLQVFKIGDGEPDPDHDSPPEQHSGQSPAPPVDPDAQAQAGGWDSRTQRDEAWAAVLAGLDPAVLRRLKLWKADNAKGSTVAAHTATAVAREWFAAHRQAQVDRGEDPFDSQVEVEGADREAVDGYVRSLTQPPQDGPAAPAEADRAGNGQQDPDPGRPFEEGDGT